MTSQTGPVPAQGRRLTLRTLGAAGLYAADGGEPLLGPGKPLALLIFLALTPGRRTSREFLTDLLWADLEPERARSALRQVLFHLRRLLGEDALPGTEELSLAIPLATDRDEFLNAIERGNLEAAVAGYDGAFLPSFGVPGGVAFEHWADLERDRLRTAFLRSAEILVRRQLNQSRFREAQRLARTARDQVPDAEAAWRLLLEAIVAGRDFVAAAVEADALEQWATSEGILLEPVTRAAIARARQVTPPSSDAREDGALMAELTGREREFSAITAAWDAVRSGPARHLHLTAPPGLGKTRLLRDATARLRAAGAAVIETRGAPGDRDIPYSFAGDLALAIAALPGATGIAPASAAALLALNPTLSARLAGTLDTAVGDEAARRRIQALTDLVHSVADEQPFVLVIDDVHWVDPASYRLLEGVWSRLGGAHVLCLTAGRPERLPAGDGIRVLPLAPLSPTEAASLVLALGSVPKEAAWTGDFVAGLHRATRGSPLLILETLRLAMDGGALRLTDGEWQCPDEHRLASLFRAGEALRQRVRTLPGDQGWLLALLATAGTPLPLEELAAIAGRLPPEVAELLAALERHGLAARTEAGWMAAHDEIAAAGREAIAPEKQREADRVIGGFLVTAAGSDVHRLLRGIRHLATAGDEAMIRAYFRRYARLARAQQDRRPFGQLAAEVLGDDTGSPRVSALARSLPLRWRIGLWSPARDAAAVLGIVLAGAAVTATIRARDARAATLQRLVYADSTGVMAGIAIEPADWDGRNTPVRRGRIPVPLAPPVPTFRELAPVQSPDGRSVAWNQDSGDSTTLDIWLRTPAGTRRLTRQPRDDLVTSWAPDGSVLVGMSNRWSSPSVGGYDIAVFDTVTATARQLTAGPDHDGPALISPDGTRIAFLRESEDLPVQVCVVPFDGAGGPECRLPGGLPSSQLLGWSGPLELVLTQDSAGTRPLVRYDWQRDERTPVLGPYVYRGRMSPDRRWVVAALRIEGIRGFRDWIIPLDHPGFARQVDGAGGDGASMRWWEGRQDRSELVDHIAFADSTRVLLLGVSTRLGIRAFTAAGTETPVRSQVRWRSSDTLIATIDTAGEIHPRKDGVVRIEASLAGWRTTSSEFRVGGKPATTVFEERWDGDWQGRWITFGDPSPLVAAGPGGIRGFWNRGDGTYQSMALLRRGFSAKDGLGVEMRVSTPLVRSSWQRLRTVLGGGLDTAAYRGADQQKAGPSLGRQDASCAATYPAGSGRHGQTQVAVLGGLTMVLDAGPSLEELRSGRWWTLRLQILPDGRCGVAINGKVFWVSPEPMPLEGEFRLRLGDESAGTKLLHGPLQVWTGVRTDIDWSRPPAR